MDSLMSLLSDKILFWGLQGSLFSILAISLVICRIKRETNSRGKLQMNVSRGDKSMGIFYGTYGALNGLLVALCLTVEVAKGHRVFWALMDTIIPAYLCLFNPWSRNKILGWTHYLRNLEAHSS